MLVDVLRVDCIVSRLVLRELILKTDRQVVDLSFLEEEHLEVELFDTIRLGLSFSLDVQRLHFLITAHDWYFPLLILRRDLLCVIQLYRLEIFFYS